MAVLDVGPADEALAKLVEMVALGDEVVLSRDGVALARVVPVPVPLELPKRQLGGLRGQFHIPDDFDTMCQEEIIALFEGR